MTLAFFAAPPAAFPFAFGSVVAAFLRLRPVVVVLGVSYKKKSKTKVFSYSFLTTFFDDVGVDVVTFRVTEKNVSSLPCCVVARALLNFFEPLRIRSSLERKETPVNLR